MTYFWIRNILLLNEPWLHRNRYSFTNYKTFSFLFLTLFCSQNILIGSKKYISSMLPVNKLQLPCYLALCGVYAFCSQIIISQYMSRVISLNYFEMVSVAKSIILFIKYVIWIINFMVPLTYGRALSVFNFTMWFTVNKILVSIIIKFGDSLEYLDAYY